MKSAENKESTDCRLPNVSAMIAALSSMLTLKHMYTGVIGLSEESYQRMIKNQKEKIEKALTDPRYQPWP